MTTLVTIGPVCKHCSVNVELWHDVGDIGVAHDTFTIQEGDSRGIYIYPGNQMKLTEKNNEATTNG